MKHYTAEQWSDFARGVVAGVGKAAMQHHLDGCNKCAEQARLWHRVASVAKRQQVPEPPAHMVRSAKALLGMENLRAPAKPTVAELLFDSMLAPAAAGARSAAADWPRQLLFGVGDHRIDLRMEPKMDADKVAIIGQVLDSAHPDEVFSKIPVSLHLGKRMLACAETNGIGEFELECDLLGRLELRATLPHGQLISLWLAEPATTPAAEPPYPIDSKQERRARREGRSSRKRN
jgi:hypothetical protein